SCPLHGGGSCNATRAGATQATNATHPSPVPQVPTRQVLSPFRKPGEPATNACNESAGGGGKPRPDPYLGTAAATNSPRTRGPPPRRVKGVRQGEAPSRRTNSFGRGHPGGVSAGLRGHQANPPANARPAVAHPAGGVRRPGVQGWHHAVLL